MPTRLFDMIVSSLGDLTASGLLLRLALVSLSMFATIHLLSLWGTRYGDNNTSAKSFFLSLVLHCCFGLGWATVAETYPHGTPGAGPVESAIKITFVESEDVAPRPGTSKLPIFNAGPSNAASLLSRDPRGMARRDQESTSSEINSPPLEKSPDINRSVDIPSLATQLDDRGPELESTASVASRPSRAAAAGESTIVEPQLEARTTVDPRTLTNGANSARQSSPRSTEAEESIPRTDYKKGSASRTSPINEEGLAMSLQADVNETSLPKPQGLTSLDTIRRPGSPNPSTIVDSTVGSGADGKTNSPGVPGGRRQPRNSKSIAPDGDGLSEVPSRASMASRPALPGRQNDDRITSNQTVDDSADDSPKPSIESSKSPSMTRAPARAPETYQARTLGNRMGTVLKHGGSLESEKAVENSLKWLASVQEFDGSWSASRHGGGASDKDPQTGMARKDGGKYADTGVTGLVLLSFLGAGHTHEQGPHTAEVRRGIRWLIAQQDRNGNLGADAGAYDQNYCHAMATFALAEAYAMQKDANDYPELRAAVEKGVAWITELQNDDGGWRYKRREATGSDMSMFGWQLMALKSARNGGISIPKKTLEGMVKFLEARGIGEHGGLAKYRLARDSNVSPAMTAEALFCRQMFMLRVNDDASQEAVAYLMKHLPRVSEYDEYYWYYGTLAMHNIGDQHWETWNNSLRDMLISFQREEGPLAGSWDPRGKWAGIGGRLYSTAISTLCLEVYYRYTTIARPDPTP